MTAIINGQVVLESGVTKATIIIEKGKIAGILSSDEDYKKAFPECDVIDAGGQYVVPGGVDGHIHFGGFGDIPIADDFYSGSCAALAGGTTTIVDFCEPDIGQDPVDCIKRRKELGEKAAVDYAFHYTFTEDYDRELKKLDRIIDEGITAFKAFTYYPHTSLLPGDFREIMEHIHDKGTLLVHAEEKSIIDNMKKRFPPDRSDMTALSLTRPNISEKIAVENVLAIAKETGTKLCIAHTSAHETIEIKSREEKEGNNNFFLESCPHYMEFTIDKLKGEKGAMYTMNPPLRYEKDNEAIKQAVMDGLISVLSTDHCPYLTRYKLGNDYETVPCGVDGVQTRMQYAFSEFVMKRKLPIESFVKLTSSNAAKFYNLYPQKGTINVGSDADLAFFDPAIQWTYDKDLIAGATDYTIYEGFGMTGRCTRTIKAGKTVMKDGTVKAEKGTGKFLFTTNK